MWKENALNILSQIEKSNRKGRISSKGQIIVNQARNKTIHDYKKKLNELNEIDLKFQKVAGSRTDIETENFSSRVKA